MASRVPSFRAPNSHWRYRPLFFGHGPPPPPKPVFRFQSTQPALKDGQFLQDAGNESLDDVFEALSSKYTAWNHPGSAQFDFRSKLLPNTSGNV
jgi:hypothetical protein